MAVYLGNRLVSGAAIGLGSTNSIIRPLPEEYQEVEWIGNNGSAYIVTDFIPRIGDEIYLELMFKQTGAITQFSSENSTYMCGMMDDYYKYFTTGSASQFGTPLLDRWYEIRFSNTGLQFRINKTTAGSASQDTETPKAKGETDAPLHIFHRASNNQIANSRMKYIRFKRRGEYVFNAIPCYRKSDNVIGMYDVVSDTFYTNQGTGTFSKGIDIIAEKYNKPIVTQKFKAYYIVYDNELADYRCDYIQDINPGDVITLKPGVDVAAAHVGTEDENPDLTFQHWSCPIEQINGTITIPSRVDCDLYIGAVYVPKDGLDHWIYDQYGNNTRRYYGNTTTNLNYAEYENDYLKVVMPSATTKFTNPWLVYNLRMTTFIVPQGVTQLDRVFSDGGITNIKYLVIPHGMTALKGSPCLGGLRAAHHVWMPDTITSINSNALTACAFSYFHVPKNLSGVLPQHFLWAPRIVVTRLVLDCPITSLDTYCIRSAYIGALYLPSTLESFAGSSFDTTRANVLVCTATTPPTAGGGFLTAAMKRVYVPVGSVSAYETATHWSAFLGKYMEYTRANCEANGDEYIELQ